MLKSLTLWGDIKAAFVNNWLLMVIILVLGLVFAAFVYAACNLKVVKRPKRRRLNSYLLPAFVLTLWTDIKLQFVNNWLLVVIILVLGLVLVGLVAFASRYKVAKRR